MHCRTAWGQWAVQLLRHTAPLPGGAVGSGTLQYTALLRGGSGQWTSCNARAHRLGSVGCATPAIHCPAACGAAGSGSPAMHYPTARGHWVVELLQRTASLPGGQWVVELLQRTAPPPRGGGRWDFCITPPHCLGVVGSGNPATHRPTAWGQWGGGGGGAPAAVPRTMGLGVVPRGSHADQPRESSVFPPLEQDESRRTPENAPPSRPSGSQRRCTTTVRSDLLSGPCHRPLRTVLDPPELASQDQRDVRCGSPGASPPTSNAARQRARSGPTMRTAGGLSTPGVASTVTLHDHAHRRWPRYPRVL